MRSIFLNWASDIRAPFINPHLEEDRRRLQHAQDNWATNPPKFSVLFEMQTSVAREALAKHLGVAESHKIVLTTGTLAGLQLVTKTLAWGTNRGVLRLGDAVVTTDLEYGDTYRELCHLFRVQVVPIADCSCGSDVVDSILRECLNVQAKALVLSHVSLFDGRILPVHQLRKALRDSGSDALVIVDGAQALGNVAVDIEKIDPDIYVGCFHKWLQGPNLTGWAWFRDDEVLREVARRANHLLAFDQSVLEQRGNVAQTGCSKSNFNAVQVACLGQHLEWLNEHIGPLHRQPASWDRAKRFERALLENRSIASRLAPSETGIVSFRMALVAAAHERRALEKYASTLLSKLSDADSGGGDSVIASAYVPTGPDEFYPKLRQPAVLRFSISDAWNSDKDIEGAVDRAVLCLEQIQNLC